MRRHEIVDRNFEPVQSIPHIPGIRPYFLARNLGSKKMDQLGVSTGEAETLKSWGIEVQPVTAREVDKAASVLLLLNEDPRVKAVTFKAAKSVKAIRALEKANHQLAKDVILIV